MTMTIGRITTCSVEEAEENAKRGREEARAHAKVNLDGGAGPFHKNFLMFLDMAESAVADKRIPERDADFVWGGICQLLSMYDRLKNLDPETLFYVNNYSLAVHYTAWLYWEKRRCIRAQDAAAKSRTKWHGPVRQRAIDIHSDKPDMFASTATDNIIKWANAERLKLPDRKDLTLPGRETVYDFVRSVFNELNENSYPIR
jgi:hypothetical protein